MFFVILQQDKGKSNMTVKEFIEKLQQCEQDIEVLVWCHDGVERYTKQADIEENDDFVYVS